MQILKQGFSRYIEVQIRRRINPENFHSNGTKLKHFQVISQAQNCKYHFDDKPQHGILPCIVNRKQPSF